MNQVTAPLPPAEVERLNELYASATPAPLHIESGQNAHGRFMDVYGARAGDDFVASAMTPETARRLFSALHFDLDQNAEFMVALWNEWPRIYRALTAAPIDGAAITAQISEWTKTPDGAAVVRDALKRAEDCGEALAKSRRIDPAIMNVPFTDAPTVAPVELGERELCDKPPFGWIISASRARELLTQIRDGDAVDLPPFEQNGCAPDRATEPTVAPGDGQDDSDRWLSCVRAAAAVMGDSLQRIGLALGFKVGEDLTCMGAQYVDAIGSLRERIADKEAECLRMKDELFDVKSNLDAARRERDALSNLLAEHGAHDEAVYTSIREQRDTLRAKLASAELAREKAQIDANQSWVRVINLEAKLNKPELRNFADGVVREAAHQRERWGVEHDVGKQPSDWFWLVGYLAGKALASHIGGNTDKALHHCISTSAALANWHAALSGASNTMQPGHAPSVVIAGEGTACCDGTD